MSIHVHQSKCEEERLLMRLYKEYERHLVNILRRNPKRVWFSSVNDGLKKYAMQTLEGKPTQ